MFTVKPILIGAYSYAEPDVYRFKQSALNFYSLVMKLEASLGQDQKTRSMSVDHSRLSARPLRTEI